MSGRNLKGLGRGCWDSLLDTELETSLSAYAAVAAAAGVSLLALATPAEAKIVYTPANTIIPLNGGPVPFDLNHDGMADFFVSNQLNGTAGDGQSVVQAGVENPSNAIWGRGTFSGPPKRGFRGFGAVFASAKHRGSVIGANKAYFHKGTSWLMAFFARSHYRSTSFGQWWYTERRYLGLKFTINGQVHYGWARLSVYPPGGPQNVTLTGYAYETIPNKPIITGKIKGPDVITLEPATVGRLAQGASGISAWREKK
jgi:hypothetical protein